MSDVCMLSPFVVVLVWCKSVDFHRNMCKKRLFTFSFSVTWIFYLRPQISSSSYSCLVSYLHRIEVSVAFRLWVNCIGTVQREGQTDEEQRLMQPSREGCIIRQTNV